MDIGGRYIIDHHASILTSLQNVVGSFSIWNSEFFSPHTYHSIYYLLLREYLCHYVMQLILVIN